MLGLGLLLGGAVFAHGLALGATKAEILAINDDGERQQRGSGGKEGERGGLGAPVFHVHCRSSLRGEVGMLSYPG